MDQGETRKAIMHITSEEIGLASLLVAALAVIASFAAPMITGRSQRDLAREKYLIKQRTKTYLDAMALAASRREGFEQSQPSTGSWFVRGYGACQVPSMSRCQYSSSAGRRLPVPGLGDQAQGDGRLGGRGRRAGRTVRPVRHHPRRTRRPAAVLIGKQPCNSLTSPAQRPG
jgi:hypothetical protein